MAPLLLCSEGQVTAQQSNADPPAPPVWHLLGSGLNVDTCDHSMRHQPYTCYRKLKGQNPHIIQLSRRFICELVLSPHNLCEMLLKSRVMRCDRASVPKPTGSYTCTRKYQCQRAKKSKQKAKRSEKEPVMVTR